MSYDLRQLKILKLSNGWKEIFIQSMTKDEIQQIINELKEKYRLVYPEVGRFVGTAELYGRICVKGLKRKTNK